MERGMNQEEYTHIPNTQVSTNMGTVDLYSLCGDKGLILYFYPKDMTPGCTKQACDFRDSHSDLQADGWNIVGVSSDDLDRHDTFIKKHSLPFNLIADTDHQLSSSLDMWVSKSMFGKKYMGMQRSICLMSPKGDIIKIWRKVSVIKHLKDLKKFLQHQSI